MSDHQSTKGRGGFPLASVVWFAGLAVLALLATAVQLDREARLRGELASAVPAPFQHFAQPHLVVRATEARNMEKAQAEALTLVRRRPVPAENLTLLALTSYVSGHPSVGNKAIFASASRGWRDPAVQLAMIQIAVGSGEWDVAADRLTALWIVAGDSEARRAATKMVLASEGGRQAFARRLSQRPSLGRLFLKLDPALLAPGAHVRTVQLALDEGALFDCGALSNAALALADKGDLVSARAVWKGACAAASSDDPRDYAFRKPVPGSAPGPDDWHYPKGGALTRSFVKAGQAWTLSYENDDLVSAVLASRYAGLAPGMHVARLSGRDIGTGEGDLALRIRCIGAAGKTTASRMERLSRSTSFRVPGQGCRVQQLSLVAGRGKREGLELRID